MRLLLAGACASFVLFSIAYGADKATGRVRGIYYEAERGVIVDGSMLRKPGAARWADVELDGGQRVLVQVPPRLDSSVGDLVSLHIGEDKRTQHAGEPAVLRNSRITRILPATRIASPAD